MSKENEKAIPTLEEYIAEQIAAKRTTALDKSRTRNLPAYPLKNNILSEKEWLVNLTKRLLAINNSPAPEWMKAMLRASINDERNAGYYNYVGSNCIGPTCTKTAGDNYGIDVIGSLQFRENPEQYGFKLIDNKLVRPGDIVIDVENGKGSHTMMLDSNEKEGLRFNHSNGGFGPENIRKDARYPFKGLMESYTYTGTPADSALWINQYKQIYGMAKGGIFGIPKYLGGTPKGGVLQSSTWTSEYISPFGNKKVRPIKELKELIIDKRQKEGLKRFLNAGLIPVEYTKKVKKELVGGRLDIESLRNDPEFKKNFNLHMNANNLSIANDSLINRGANNALIGAVLTLIISESGGETKPHGNGAYGLIGWRGARAKGLPKDLPGLLHHLMKGLFESHKDWSDGGPGMNIGTGKEMLQFFKDGAYNNYRKATNAVMNGYVRPPEDLKAKRHALVQIIKKYIK